MNVERDDEIRAMVQFAFLRRPLAELLEACTLASLDVIVLKGAALAETVYLRPSLRPFGDLDVLIRAEDAPRAYALLTALGYVTDAAVWRDLVSGRGCEANFFKHTERGPVVVEVHTGLRNNMLFQSQVPLDTDGLWQRSRPVCLAGREARVLGPEDQILHLCLHLACHYFAAPNSVRDIVRVCAVQSIDWVLFAALCRAADAATISYCSLFAAVMQGGAAVPSAVLEALAPRRHWHHLENLVTARIAGQEAAGTEAQRFLLVWRVLDSAGARRRAVRHLLFPSHAWLYAHYGHDLPDPLAFRHLPASSRLYGIHLGFIFVAAWKLLRKLFRPRPE